MAIKTTAAQRRALTNLRRLDDALPLELGVAENDLREQPKTLEILVSLGLASVQIFCSSRYFRVTDAGRVLAA